MVSKADLLAMSPIDYFLNLHEYEGCNAHCRDGIHATVAWCPLGDRPDLVRNQLTITMPDLDVVEVRPAPEAPNPNGTTGVITNNGRIKAHAYPHQYQCAYLILFRAPSGQDS